MQSWQNTKELKEMSNSELEEEFDLYASESGLDKNYDYDQEVQFDNWLEENDVELDDE